MHIEINDKRREEEGDRKGKEGEEWRNQIKEIFKQKDVPIIESSKLELKYTIGEGFFSTVRLATWNSINVAVKTIINDKFKSKSSRFFFLSFFFFPLIFLFIFFFNKKEKFLQKKVILIYSTFF